MSSHQEWQSEVIAQAKVDKIFSPENGNSLKFSIGDQVIYTNDYGVKFNFSVTGFYQVDDSLYARGYRYLLDSDCSWMPVKEESLSFVMKSGE